MPEFPAEADLLRSLVGQQLVAVTEARHWHHGERDADARSLLHFWLHFERTPAVMAHLMASR